MSGKFIDKEKRSKCCGSFRDGVNNETAAGFTRHEVLSPTMTRHRGARTASRDKPAWEGL